MYHGDDEPTEVLHIYVVREVVTPPLLPIFLSFVALSLVIAIGVLSPNQQPVTRDEIRVPAVLLPIRTFTAQTPVIPTGVHTYPATTAHGVLTITNGSVISQTLPAGLTFISNSGVSVVTDTAVFVPAGSANGYGVTYVSAHALISGQQGNIPAYAINRVEGSSVYIRNLAAFQGGRDSYSVKFVTLQDRQLALRKSRNLLAASVMGLHYPCSEQVSGAVIVTWHCQFLTYQVPSYMHVTAARLSGRNVLVDVVFLPRPQRIWVK